MLGSGLGQAAGSVSVLVEIDSGHHRSGVQSGGRVPRLPKPPRAPGCR